MPCLSFEMCLLLIIFNQQDQILSVADLSFIATLAYGALAYSESFIAQTSCCLRRLYFLTSLTHRVLCFLRYKNATLWLHVPLRLILATFTAKGEMKYRTIEVTMHLPWCLCKLITANGLKKSDLGINRFYSRCKYTLRDICRFCRSSGPVQTISAHKIVLFTNLQNVLFRLCRLIAIDFV